ncbi:MAG TPA: hypothetical protein PLJ44_10955 [Victivallales bacterium]|nr:hypothetical protein [Victivallales bacterium]
MQKVKILKKHIVRYEYLAFLFAIFFSASFFALLNTAIHKRAFYMKNCAKFAWTTRVIPAARGAIADKNGVLLAWTERHYNLYLQKGANPERIIPELQKKISPKIKIEKDMLLKKNLTAEEILKIAKLDNELNSAIVIKTHFERSVVEYPELKLIVGVVPEAKKGSGLEAYYDNELRGKDGIFSVMLDREKRPIWKTIIWRQEYIPGKNVKINLGFEDLRNGMIPEEIKNEKFF